MQGCSIDGVYHSLATRIKLDLGCVSMGAYSDAYDVEMHTLDTFVVSPLRLDVHRDLVPVVGLYLGVRSQGR